MRALIAKDGCIKSYRDPVTKIVSGVRLLRTQAADGLSSAETMADSPVAVGVSNGQPRRNSDDPGFKCHAGQYNTWSAACVSRDREIDQIQPTEPCQTPCQ